MAKKDVNRFYLEQQQVYLEMLEDLKDVEKAYENGSLEEEMFFKMKADVDKLKDNYDRLSFIMFLLNEPQRKEKKEAYLKKNQKYYDYLKCASKESIIDESKDALIDFKKLVEEMKNGHK